MSVQTIIFYCIKGGEIENKYKRKILWSVLLFICLVGGQSESNPQPVAVPEPIADTTARLAIFDLEPIGTDESTSKVVTRLLYEAFVKYDRYIIIDIPTDIPTQIYKAADACSIATRIGANKVLIGSLLMLGNKYTVTVRMLNVVDRSDEYADKLSTTLIEEMDVIADRIVKGIIEGKEAEKTVEVGKVIEPEIPVFKTREPFAAIMFRTGYFYGMYGNAACDMFTIESSVAYETKDIFLEALIYRRDGAYANGWYFDLLVHKIFSPSDQSAYFGGGIGIRKITDEIRNFNDDAMALTASGGLIAFRTYYFRVVTNARLSFNLNSELATQPDFGFTFGISSPQVDTKSGLGGLGDDKLCLGGCIAALAVLGLSLMGSMGF